jgi:dCTP deaminase
MLLKDDEILPLVVGDKSIVKGIGKRDNWYSKDSPIQAASLDLGVGSILIPGGKGKKRRAVSDSKHQYTLRRGQTVLISSLEELDLPKDVAAFGFPPSSVSSHGLLMTNPGHVDPGYKGKLHFTVINMGSDDYMLRQGDRIVTLLIFKLSGNASAGWADRQGSGKGLDPTQGTLQTLSHDFLDIEKRAKKIAKKQAYKAIAWSALASAVAAFAFTFAGVWLSKYISPGWAGTLATLQTQVATAKQQEDDLLTRIARLEQIEEREKR